MLPEASRLGLRDSTLDEAQKRLAGNLAYKRGWYDRAACRCSFIRLIQTQRL